MLFSRVWAFAGNKSKEVNRFVKFALVGLAGAVTHLVILNIGLAFNLLYIASNTLGFIAAVLQNFVLNRIWTFPESQARDPRGQLTRFLIVSVIGLVLNQGVSLLCRYLLLPFWSNLISQETLSARINDNFAAIVAIGFVLFWNFFANRFWTYRGL